MLSGWCGASWGNTKKNKVDVDDDDDDDEKETMMKVYDIPFPEQLLLGRQSRAFATRLSSDYI